MWEVHFTHNELGKIKISARKTVTLFVRRLFLLLYLSIRPIYIAVKRQHFFPFLSFFSSKKCHDERIYFIDHLHLLTEPPLPCTAEPLLLSLLAGLERQC